MEVVVKYRMLVIDERSMKVDVAFWFNFIFLFCLGRAFRVWNDEETTIKIIDIEFVLSILNLYEWRLSCEQLHKDFVSQKFDGDAHSCFRKFSLQQIEIIKFVVVLLHSSSHF